jgi:PPOX class probable F420-dependent enzyme
VSRRGEITLTEAEQRELLEAERVVVVATNGPHGRPHAMPLWYVPRNGEVWIYTYAKSQKVRNLERDPRATLLVETGHDYGELRGIQIEADAELHHDHDEVFELAKELTARYSGATAEGDAAGALRAQAAKRVAIHFRPLRTASWDHRKL